MAEMPSVFYMSLVASFLYAKGDIKHSAHYARPLRRLFHADPLVLRCLSSDLNAPLSGLSEFATQHALPPRQFLVLTNTGS